ncbi:hypothetical protein Sjap_017034 [Stephania japonica]|uniref:Uncharacterized protein n=1 Tax=Stephania japonica TaxID=461633 RepID=A0AAP0I5E2_9MAGN
MVDWCVVGCLVEVGIGSKHGDVSRGVKNPVSEAFCNRHRGNAMSIPAHGVTYVRLEQRSREHAVKTPPRPNKVTASLTYELGRQPHLHTVEEPPKPLDATASRRHDTVHYEIPNEVRAAIDEWEFWVLGIVIGFGEIENLKEEISFYLGF